MLNGSVEDDSMGKADIKVAIVEYVFLREGREGLISYLASKYYRTLPSVRNKGSRQNALFMKNS